MKITTVKALLISPVSLSEAAALLINCKYKRQEAQLLQTNRPMLISYYVLPSGEVK